LKGQRCFVSPFSFRGGNVVIPTLWYHTMLLESGFYMWANLCDCFSPLATSSSVCRCSCRSATIVASVFRDGIGAEEDRLRRASSRFAADELNKSRSRWRIKKGSNVGQPWGSFRTKPMSKSSLTLNSLWYKKYISSAPDILRRGHQKYIGGLIKL